ncbi:hypothetical protein AN640_01400 [Candidatus Epulonipiscium fishelsonii]|uniref:Uncharacterized protein n=1 Tax=Candidatus Epulonipiscium fishelsonii TaxID=77094 RepID=A0ACC8XC77_9FIRM|nr:hypothetical protein AN640_01400 [Epulopiscium sp. SCG-D08WGA-EpuloA1]
MKTNIKSEIYRFIHSPLLPLHIIVPILGSFIFVAYFATSNWSEEGSVSAFIQALSVTFPVLIGIIMGLSCDFEQNAGGFQIMLTTKSSKLVPHISKIIVLLILGLISAILALGLFYIGFYFFNHTSFSAWFFIQTAIFMFISMIPLYLLSYVISFLYGKGMSISIGIVGGMVSALLLTGLGDNNWFYTPWGLAARLSLFPLIRDVGNNASEMNCGIISVLIFTAILTILFILIFRKWEGKRIED